MNENRSWLMGGMLFSFPYSLLQTDVFKTMLLAIIGTLTTYLCGKILTTINKWFYRNKK